MGPVVKLLQAIASLTRSGAIKSLDDAYRLAQRELGERFSTYQKQIKDAFDAGTRKQKSGDVIPFKKKEGIESLKGKVKKEGEVVPFTKKPDTPDQVPGLESLKNPFRPGGGLDQVTGITRALARRILDRKGIKIGDKDPIDTFTDTFGEAIGDVKNLAEEMIEIDARGGGMKDMDKMLEIEGLFDIEIPKNPSKGYTNKEMLDLMEETEQEDILKKFDPEDREPNSRGGINRASFARGKIKLVQFLAGKGKDLAKEIKKSVDDIFTTNDIKYDADVAVDNMLDDLGIDRDTVDQKDLMDAYGMAYDELKKPFLSKIKNKPGPFTGKDIDLPDDVDPRDTILPTKKIIDDVDEAYNVTPKMKEELALKEKYPGLDDELVTAIVDDPDPDNKAQVLATLDTLMELQRQGKTPEEAVDIIKQTMFKGRKDNAEGGLNYLMGM